MWKWALNITGELSSCLVLSWVPSTGEKSSLQQQGALKGHGVSNSLCWPEMKVGHTPSGSLMQDNLMF